MGAGGGGFSARFISVLYHTVGGGLKSFILLENNQPVSVIVDIIYNIIWRDGGDRH